MVVVGDNLSQLLPELFQISRDLRRMLVVMLQRLRKVAHFEDCLARHDLVHRREPHLVYFAQLFVGSACRVRVVRSE